MLEITLPPREVTIAPGRAARADFAVPSGRTRRAAACPGVPLGAGRGAIAGRVVDADTDAPLVGASVVLAWRELAVARATADRVGEVRTDSLGRYRLCGVPTDEWGMLQVQHDDWAGSEIRLLVPDSAGVVRHLSLSDRRGRLTLGDLPSGTQVLEVRRLGYLLAQRPVELRRGRSVAQDVRLQRLVTLDSVRALARRSRYREFEEHRRVSGLSTFLTEDDIARRRPFEASDVFRTIPGSASAATASTQRCRAREASPR